MLMLLMTLSDLGPLLYHLILVTMSELSPLLHPLMLLMAMSELGPGRKMTSTRP